ncbi:MAG TPA: putative toxin-antitoxin system toxin component, PIN family [Burkholderiales bacterium]|nr:putative toxin-antitoxin system toxin component, PIN family [Burkholderiales bacterium]
MGEKAEIARPRRVVLDTNVAVSALVFREGRLAWLREAWEAGRIVPIVSAETVAELVRVLAYPKLKLSEEETKNVLAHYMEHAEAVREAGASVRVPERRDPDDRKFLQLAYAAKADALVTGDEDLLTLAGKSRVPILTPEALKAENP